MSGINYKDMIGGVLGMLIGGFVFFYGIQTYQLGTINRMGPGMAPVALGAILAGLGLLLVIKARLGPPGTAIAVDWRPLIFISASLIVFVAGTQYLGMLPATALTVIVASRADGRLSPLAVTALGIVMAVAVYVIFDLGLKVPLPLFRNPLS